MFSGDRSNKYQVDKLGLRDLTIEKLAQGLHARYLVDDFEAAARFVAAIATAGNAVGHHPRVRIADGVVDLELVTDDAVYRDEDGTAHSVEWVTQQDVDLARKITDLAAAQGLRPDPAAVSEIELGLDTAAAADIAPVWAALLTGGPIGELCAWREGARAWLPHEQAPPASVLAFGR